jgi:hypothetical protein
MHYLRLRLAVASAWLATACETGTRPPGTLPGEDAVAETTPPSQETSLDLPPPADGACPPSTVTLSFEVDDSANQTYLDGQLLWTGSFAWDQASNHLAYATSWLPEEGPYPPLYDDGPRSLDGHEPEGAVAGDHRFGVAVCYQADTARSFAYGVLNEDLRWIWIGKNGGLEIAAGATGVVPVPGLSIPPFGDRDLRVALDKGALHLDFAGLDASYKVYLKGTMNSWAPVQLLDDGVSPDDAAGDDVYTYQQSVFLGPHDGLLAGGSEVQFAFVLAKGETDPDDGLEYKVDGDARPEGVTAQGLCGGSWVDLPVALALDSKGKSMNTAVTLCEEAPPDPGCAPEVLALDPTQGSTEGGTQVALYGTCLDNDTIVLFEATPGAEVDWNAAGSFLSVVAPAHPAGTVDLTVKNAAGRGSTFQSAFSFVDRAPPPEILEVVPATGSPTGGTPVEVLGKHFQPGASVWFGPVLVDAPVVGAEGGSISGSTPPGVPGAVAVKVKNPDGQEAILEGGFTYTAGQPQWALFEGPSALNVEAGQMSPPLVAQVYKEGATPGPGPASSLVAEVGFGPEATDPQSAASWTWVAASYLEEAGNNDRFQGTLTIATPGVYRTAFRFGAGDGAWLVADLDGTDNGLEQAELGLLQVADPGVAVAITALEPSIVSPVGSAWVKATGKGFDAACVLLVDTMQLAFAEGGSASEATFLAPARPPGTRPVSLSCPGGMAASWLTYQASWDGLLGEWEAIEPLAESSLTTDWGAGENELAAFFAASDGQTLYVAVAGRAMGGAFGPNAICVYLDADFGSATGLQDTVGLDAAGAVDSALGGLAGFSAAGYGAEAAFATLDMASYDPAKDGADPAGKAAGWRGLAPTTDLPWLLEGGVYASAAAVEATLPLAALYPEGPQQKTRTIGLVARISNQDGTALANQSLPAGVSGAQNQTATQAAVFTLWY